ncbi:hypothetical protein HNQ64_004066 [Prosthecobacter dejongeii]|uniref:Uncharacterized protein n=1 Tax=Prosthecobacter dejongeii TaxID=48465 RepID=A0A7W7YP68_9BACT|nr:hypothetical protein [Prosthecobacter dejongeii]
MNEAVTSLLAPWQRYRMTRFLVFLWLVLVFAFGTLMWSGNMLLPWQGRLLAASIVGIVAGTLGLAVAGVWIFLGMPGCAVAQAREASEWPGCGWACPAGS